MINKSFMEKNLVTLFLLSLTLPGIISAAETAYQWTDGQGQIHYGDKPPASDDSRSIVLQGNTMRPDSQTGLRPGERERLGQMEQRQRQQQQRAYTTRAHTDRQRAARRAQCASNRERLDNSRGRDAFKQYARYLRKNCW